MGLLRILFRALAPVPRRRSLPPKYRPVERPRTAQPKAAPGARARRPATVVRLETIAAARQRTISGRAWVVDGDTIILNRINIRLFGIDAPELDHPFGIKAKWAMYHLTKGQRVTAYVTGEMSYDRVVARCVLDDGRDLSAELVRQGLAIDWPRYSGGAYGHLEPQGIRKKLWRADRRQWAESYYRQS